MGGFSLALEAMPMERRELIRKVRECASRYDTTVAYAARRALHIMDGPAKRTKPKRHRKRKVKGIGCCFRNEQSPMDW